MDTAASKAMKWHLEIVPPKTRKALDLLSRQSWLKHSQWYLAGGTALALQAGHRSSIDLDFFFPRGTFDLVPLLERLKKFDWKTRIVKQGTVYGELLGAKVSFIAYPFFVPKFKPSWYGAIRVLHPRDIGVMKIIAISQRGRKRDFFDLYWCANNVEPLEEIIRRLNIQYPTIGHNYHHILKSLVYFDDAEADPMPKIFFKAAWKEVKRFFQKEAAILTKKLIGLR